MAMAERTIALSTGTIELSLAPGSSASETIIVSNEGDEPLKALVYTADVAYDASGTPAYIRPDSNPQAVNGSPALWLSLQMPKETQVIANTPYIVLEPGESIPVSFELEVPEGATPGDHTAIIFFEMFSTEDVEGASSQISGRIGARIDVRVAGEVIEKLDVAPFSIRELIIGDSAAYSFTLSNLGNIDKHCTTSLVVLDRSENEVLRSQIESDTAVYAGSSRSHADVLDLSDVGFGKYTVRAEVVYDRETSGTASVADVLAKDRTVWVVPLWLAIVVLLVVGLPILYLIWRSGVRSAARKAAKKAERDAARRARAERARRAVEDTDAGARRSVEGR